MRRIGFGLLLLTTGVLGCTTPKTTRPPPHPEEFVMPPGKEARYLQPQFPREAMNLERQNTVTPAGGAGPGAAPGLGKNRPGSMGMSGS